MAASALGAYRAIRWFLAGSVGIGIGIWLILDPNLEGQASLSTSGDRTAGICALLAGVGIIAVGWFVWFKK